MIPLTEATSPLASWGTAIAILVLLVALALLAIAENAAAIAPRARGPVPEHDPAFGLARTILATAAAALAGWLLATLASSAGRGIALTIVGLPIVAVLIERLAGAARLEPLATAVTAPLLAALAPFAPHRTTAEHPSPAEATPATPETHEEEERARIFADLDLGARRVEEVMMHRRDIEMIDASAPPDEILAQAINSAHTRLPIFRGEPENIVGVIHAKDLSRAVHRFVQEHRGGQSALEGFDVTDVAMEPYFIPESTPLDEQMREFLRRRSHFALVVDEYGALQGLVTLEDIIEEIVGDISDEHDLEEPDGIEPQADGSVIVDGGLSIRDLNRARDWELPDDEANTIAGLVIHEAQSIPSPGQSFEFHGLRFEVLDREGNRLTRLRLRPLP